MPQDAFHLRRIATELNTFLVGGKINRVSQIDKDELHFIIYTGFSTVKLLLSTNASNARVCLSEQEKEPLALPPAFCMLCRKHLQGARIIEIRQCGFERIIEIRFHCASDFFESERSLYCELMGKYSNLVLVENGVILGALKTTSLEENVKRILFSGARYAFPSPQDKVSPFAEEFKAVADAFEQKRASGETDEELAFYLFDKVAGLALPTAREVVKRLNGIPVYEFLPNFIENEPNNPHLLYQAGEAIDYFAFEVAGGRKCPSLNKAEDVFYTAREEKKSFESAKRKLDSAVRAAKKKQAKKLSQTLEKLAEAEEAEEEKIKGELLTANFYKIDKGLQEVELDDWYRGGKIKIKLDTTLTPQKNAQKYFKAYAKKKRAKEALLPRKDEEEKELSYLETVAFSVENASSKTDLKEIEEELILAGLLKEQKSRQKKKEIPVPFREFYFDGFTVLVGRNNLQNERLLRQAKGEDIWLHAQKYHSSHVIIKTDGKKVSENTLLFAAEVCAYYSSGRNGDKISVDYCERKFVKKPPKAKTGFVIYSEYKTLLVTPNAHAREE